MVQRFLVSESLKNALALKQQQLMVKQMCEHYKILLKYFDKSGRYEEI
jgi:hypothetical protein